MNPISRNGRSARAREQLTYWLIWNIGLPVILLFLFWPLYQFVFEVPLSFGRSFGNGDLLLFSGLLLIMTSVRLDPSASRKKLNFLWDLQRAFALIVLTVYGMMRLDVAHQNIVGTVDESKLSVYSLFSLSVLALAITLAVFNVTRDVWIDRDEPSDA